MTTIDVLASPPNILGESPWWDIASGRLLWVDILGKKIRSSTLDGELLEEISTPTEVGFTVATEDGRLLAGLRSGVALVNASSQQITMVWEDLPHAPQARINDGKTDRRGRVLFGTLDESSTSARCHLFTLDSHGAHTLLQEIWLSNGLAWSPAGDRFYYTDSTVRTTWAFDYDLDTGRISNRTVLFRDNDQCVPDGLTVDSDGCIWSAKWNGSRIVRYTPAGDVDQVIELPVHKPTSIAFCGPDLRTMAVTTASIGEPDDTPLAGATLLIEASTPGIAETPAALRFLPRIH